MSTTPEEVTTIRALSVSLNQRLGDMERLNQERDTRYDERHTANEKAVAAAFAANKEAVAAAFAAAKEAVTAALAAAKEAVVKAEQAQSNYNANHNDLARKMEDQYDHMLPRVEADAKFDRQNERFDDLKREAREQSNLNTSRVITLVIAAVGISVGVIEFFLRAKP